MPPVIAKAPNPINFSRNQVDLQVFSADFVATAQAIAVNRVSILAAITDGVTINFNWTGSAALMTAKDLPDASGTQFPTGDGSAAYVQTLVDWFQGNFFIDHDFVVTSDIAGAHPGLIFTARNAGQQYNFTIYATATASSTVDQPGADGTPKLNFHHHLELWIDEGNGEFDQAYSANVPLDYPVDGHTTIDISDALHAFLDHDLPVLATLKQFCTNSIRNFYIKYAAFYGASPIIQRSHTTGMYTIARGGLSKQAALLRDIVAELCPVVGVPAQNKCMRQGSKNIMVTSDQPEWLTWINLTGAVQNITLEVKIYNTDATSATVNIWAQNVAAYQKLQFQTGFTWLNLHNAQDVSKVPVYYSIRVTSAGGYLSAAYNYVIDYRYWEWARYFVYENAYGAFQTLATVGKGQTDFDLIKDDAQRSVDQITEGASGSFIECNILFQDKGTVAIGYQRSGLRNTRLIRTFLASEKKYLYQDGQLKPIGITTKNLKDTPDGENVYANSFEYYLLYQESNYTEDPALADDDLGMLLPGAGIPPPASSTVIVGIKDSLTALNHVIDGI